MAASQFEYEMILIILDDWIKDNPNPSLEDYDRFTASLKKQWITDIILKFDGSQLSVFTSVMAKIFHMANRFDIMSQSAAFTDFNLEGFKILPQELFGKNVRVR